MKIPEMIPPSLYHMPPSVELSVPTTPSFQVQTHDTPFWNQIDASDFFSAEFLFETV